MLLSERKTGQTISKIRKRGVRRAVVAGCNWQSSAVSIWRARSGKPAWNKACFSQRGKIVKAYTEIRKKDVGRAAVCTPRLAGLGGFYLASEVGEAGLKGAMRVSKRLYQEKEERRLQSCCGRLQLAEFGGLCLASKVGFDGLEQGMLLSQR